MGEIHQGEVVSCYEPSGKEHLPWPKVEPPLSLVMVPQVSSSFWKCLRSGSVIACHVTLVIYLVWEILSSAPRLRDRHPDFMSNIERTCWRSSFFPHCVSKKS